jgi:predicted GIY-YIG superfamily endonuclease
MNWVVYILSGIDSNLVTQRTYVGITNNLPRRIRQHNCELKGGAKYTTAHAKSLTWTLECTIEGLDVSSVRKLEWRLHRPAKNKKQNYAFAKSQKGKSCMQMPNPNPNPCLCPLSRRMRQLGMAMWMDKWTSSAKPVSEVVTEGMQICFHTPNAKALWFDMYK